MNSLNKGQAPKVAECFNPLAVLREPTTNPQQLPYIPGAAPLHSSSSPHTPGCTWAIQGPEGAFEDCRHKPEDKRLNWSIQCIDRAQKTFTLLINRKKLRLKNFFLSFLLKYQIVYPSYVTNFFSLPSQFSPPPPSSSSFSLSLSLSLLY
jgi:hypothetical protein